MVSAVSSKITRLESLPVNPTNLWQEMADTCARVSVLKKSLHPKHDLSHLFIYLHLQVFKKRFVDGNA